MLITTADEARIGKTRIQRRWRACITDPSHPVCRRRLTREGDDLNGHPLTPPHSSSHGSRARPRRIRCGSAISDYYSQRQILWNTTSVTQLSIFGCCLTSYLHA